MQTNRNKIIAIVVLVIILISTYFIFDKKSEVSTNNEQIATTTTDGTGSVSAQGQGGYTIEPVEFEDTLPKPIPNLNREVSVSVGAIITPEATASATPKIKSLQEILKKNPADFNSWISLGIHQKQAGDYEGARISWEYASKLAPSDHISLGNLGNLYAYFIKDNTKAESYYKQAINRGPTQVNLYVQLAEVYVNFFSDKSKALAIINQGLTKVPNDPSLLQVKASLE